MATSITDRGLFGYAGKRVVVSGCCSGIGAATASLLLELGAEVHGIDLATPDAAVHPFSQLDLREPRNVGAVVQGIGGPVDALFNCAGVPPGRPPLDVMKVNFLGTRLLTEVVLPLMLAGGAVVSVGSNGGMGWTSRLPALLDFVGTPSYGVAAAWCEANAETVAEGYRFSKEALLVWTLRSSVRSIKERNPNELHGSGRRPDPHAHRDRADNSRRLDRRRRATHRPTIDSGGASLSARGAEQFCSQLREWGLASR
jgi:hypothetical protein